MADNGKVRLPKKFTALVRQLHDGTRPTVLANDDTSDSFPVTNGVKQGCVELLPLPSSTWYSLPSVYDASQDNDDGIKLKYRTDVGAFNLRRLKPKTKVKVATLRGHPLCG